MNKLTIILSGRKQAGKNTACNFIIAKFLNLRASFDNTPANDGGYPNIPVGAYYISQESGLLISRSARPARDGGYPTVTDQFVNKGVKVYSFADPLKRFLMDVFNVPFESCYGTDAEKNTPLPHIRWENLPKGLRQEQIMPSIDGSEFNGQLIGRRGPMTGRELMQVWGTDLCRKLYGDCWARGTYNAINREGVELALVCDGRFPNEIELGSIVGAKTIRLQRNIFNDNHRSETALDNFPIDKYTVAIDNQDLDIQGTCDRLEPLVDQWFEAAGIRNETAMECDSPRDFTAYVIARRGDVPE